MDHITLEKELKTYIRKRRILEAIVCVTAFAILIASFINWQQSQFMDEIPLGVMLGSFVLGVSGYLLVKDFMLSNVVTARVKEDYVTFYRGVCYTKLYVNGECKDSAGMRYYMYQMKATLSDNTKVYVAIGRYGAHISFENGRTPIEV